jgi:YVTN family beta-propeller protein
MAVLKASNLLKLFMIVFVPFLAIVNRIAVETNNKTKAMDHKVNDGDSVYYLVGDLGANQGMALLQFPDSSVVTPDRTKAYVIDQGSDTVSVIDLIENQLTATVPVGANPCILKITNDGMQIYVANCGSNTLSVISTKTDQVMATISVPATPYAIAITSDGSRVVVTHDWIDARGGGGITIVDTTNIEDKTMKRTKTICIKGSKLGEPILVYE